MSVKTTNWKKIGATLLIVGAIFALLSQTKAANESDAIAVRVMPNTNHDSIETWYAKQGFKGSPQSLMVDGYEAIRDGRTVFVNAANVDTPTKKIYTNIYLISYNQESETKTLDILGQLVSHWKFNNNISEPGYCAISKINCQADKDCSSDYLCSNSGSSKGKCVLKSNKVCTIDSDCPVNLFCDNLKSSAIRDVKRLGELSQISGAIESYKNTSGSYPSLQSGTYILGSSMSVWPSWKETLWGQLGLGQVLVDPINSLGYCDGYDATTCWDNKTNAFINSDLTLPGGSYGFVYRTTKNGINYSLCSIFETKFLGYDTQDKKISANACSIEASYSGSSLNTAPSIVSSYLNGESGKEFSGYIKIKDAEGDTVSWSLATDPGSFASWSKAPVLQDTGDSNQKKIYAATAGSVGSYNVSLTLTDSRGATNTIKLTINIGNPNKPRIEAEDITYFVDPVTPLKYTFTVEGTNSKPTYTFTALNPAISKINAAVTLAATNNVSVTSVGLNKNKVEFSVLIPAPMAQDTVVPFRVIANAGGVTSVRDINFNLKVEKPNLDFQCENIARIGGSYQISGTSCLLGSLKSGNHSLGYSVSGPTGLAVVNGSDNAYLKANIISSADTKEYPVSVSVSNEYGASAQKTFNLKLNNFCGDGIKQTPNTEGQGGFYNDGVESCDGSQGIQTNSISTSSSIQYGCTTESGSASPYPITDNNSCVFKAADAGGGYCGDGVCQFKIKADGVSKPMENCWNCRQDCGICLATLESSADKEQMTYFNSKFLYKTADVGTLGTKKIALAPGKNVFSFWAQDLNDDNYGLAFKLTAGASTTAAVTYASGTLFQEFSTKAPLPEGSLVCKFVPRASGFNSVSASSYDPSIMPDPYLNWTGLSYDDSSWGGLAVNPDKDWFKGVPYIWATGNHNGEAVFCRLTFDYKPYSMTACVPNCSGKNCGSDGCGGYCGTATDGGCKVTQRCISGKCICKPNCTGNVCGSDGCGGVCGANSGACPLAYGNVWFNNSVTSFGWTSAQTEQKCTNGQCGCKPDCTNRTCGSDGCGGDCGVCGAGAFCNNANQCQDKCFGRECGPNPVDGGSCGTCSGGTCIDGQCPSSDTNIQICSDNAHTSYFNGSNTASNGKAMVGNNWQNIEEFPVKLSDQNIFAIKASDWGGIHGVSATLNVKVDNVVVKSLNTSDTNGWRCNRIATSGWTNDWNADSLWSSAISMNNANKASGNALYKQGISQIWLNDASYPDPKPYTSFSYSTESNPDVIYCRYKFNAIDIKLPCTPKCSGKCAGPDSCGGFCYNSCPSGQTCGGNESSPNTCAVKTCTPKCGAGVCGGDNGCNGICPNVCPNGQTCGGDGVYNQCG